MAKDKNGNELAIDDNIIVACTVTQIEPDAGDGYCRIHVQTVENFFPADHKTNLKLSSRQVSLVDSTFNEVMSEEEATDQINNSLYPSEKKSAVAPMAKAHDDSLSNELLRKHIVGSHLAALRVVMAHPRVAVAIKQARAGGVPWADIIAAILPFILGIFTGAPVDWAAIVAAILALFNKSTQETT